jgi:D-alanyl-D-alanine-carboxypeptidase/D-alanyl-D-alanine-endopeptidase
MTTTAPSIEEILHRRAGSLVAGGDAPGVVAGAVRNGRDHLLCLGRTASADGRPMDSSALHELGSISKTFTGLLLADMVRRGEVGYDTPVAAFLPMRADQVTLADLVTHTAGLPRTPGAVYRTMLRSGRRDPYARYGIEDLYRTASRVRSRRRGEFRYSSLGFGLLGQALANAAGSTYPRLLAERVLRPIGMDATTADSDAPAVPGHRRGRPVPSWRFQALAGAGAVRANGTDLLRYLRAQVYPHTTTLPEAIRDTHQPRRPGKGDDSICVAWFHRVVRGVPLLWHEGATAGFCGFIGLSPSTGAGVFVVANTGPTWRQPVIRTGRRAFGDLVRGS